MWIRDVGIVADRLRQARDRLLGARAALCARMGIGEGHVSLTDEAGVVVAFAVLLRSPAHEYPGVRHRDRARRRVRSALPRARRPRRRGCRAGHVRPERERSGTDFLPLHQHRVVAISCAMRSRDGFKHLVARRPRRRARPSWWRASSTASSATARSWSRGTARASTCRCCTTARCAMASTAPRYWETGDADRDFRYNNYLGRFHWRHIDLMDVLAGLPAARRRAARRGSGAAGTAREARPERGPDLGCMARAGSRLRSVTIARPTC
jgi:hypothetical protein